MIQLGHIFAPDDSLSSAATLRVMMMMIMMINYHDRAAAK